MFSHPLTHKRLLVSIHDDPGTFMDHKDTSKTQRTSQTIKRLQVSISKLRWPGSTHDTHFPGDGEGAGSQRQAIPLRGGS